MKKWCRCLHISLSIVFALLWCLSISVPVSALGVTGTTDHIITSGGFGRPLANNTLEILYTVNRSGNDVWVNIPGAYTQNITAMNLNVSTPIPANSLVSFSMSFDYLNESSTGIKYYGMQFEHNRSLLYDSCENIIGQNLYVMNSGSHITWTCTYVYYNQDQTSIIDSSYGSHIFERIQPADNLVDVLNIVIGPASSIQLTNDGLSASDRTWLQTQLGNIDTSAVVSKLNEVKTQQQATTQAIEDNTTAINNQTDAINDQTDAINDQTDAINDQTDAITDDTVDTTDIDYSDITDSVPAFGPIATIINNLIDFPRVFLVDDLCQPLNTPLPDYLGASDSTYLVIPCPSDFLEPYWDAVVLFENIAASYLFFRLAIFIVRQVEYIRDPERDDEEFLQL